MMFTRKLGKSGIDVSALGMGCWAIGGPWDFNRSVDERYPAGWGQVNDKESIRAIHAGLDMGVNFFDTAANYGAGHSERILAEALKGRRDEVVIATKFGYVVDEGQKLITKNDKVVLENIRRDCEDSLRRLGTDYIDLYQFHVGDFSVDNAGAVRDMLEELVNDGKIRWYGWSTDNAKGARVFAEGEHCTAIQQAVHWATQNDYVPTLMVCEEFNLASVIRGPLGMGLLTGKFKERDVKLPDDDVRHGWNLREGRISDMIQVVEDLREILTSDGRTLAQGALGWLWARSEVTIPIPGFKSVEQVQENAKAMEFGPLSSDQMAELDRLLGRD
jgi:aryl-alcohol dehydrogenase-like predicted oxidoreductase